MPYAVRVFCTDATIPTLRQVLNWCATDGGVLMAIDTEYAASDYIDADAHTWRDAGILYREDLAPFVARVARSDDDAIAFAALLAPFRAALTTASPTAETERVRTHLDDTQFIVTCTIGDDDENDTLEAIAWFTQYFVQHLGGLLHADGEGFYADATLIVPAP